MPFGQALGGMMGLGGGMGNQRGQMNFGGQMRGWQNPGYGGGLQQGPQIGGFGGQLGQSIRSGGMFPSPGRMPTGMMGGMQQALPQVQGPQGQSPNQQAAAGIGPRFDAQGFLNSMGGQDALRSQMGQAMGGGFGGMRSWYDNMKQQMANYRPQMPQQQGEM